MLEGLARSVEEKVPRRLSKLLDALSYIGTSPKGKRRASMSTHQPIADKRKEAVTRPTYPVEDH